MHIKRFFFSALALLLATLMLSSACVMFVACGSDPGQTDSEPAASDGAEGESNSDAVSVIDYYRNLPDESDLNLNGYRFLIYSYDYTNDIDHNIYLDPSEDGGQRVQAAAWRRNNEVEGRLNCEVVLDREESFLFYLSPLSSVIKAGSCEWDLFCVYVSPDVNLVGFIQNDLLLDWNELPYVNLEEEWYNQSANEAYSIVGKQYLAVSEITRTVQLHDFMLMNKSLIEAYGHTAKEVYNVVMSRKWTTAQLDAYVKDTYRDTNSTIPGPDAGDTYGLGISSNFSADFITAAGVIPVSIDGETVTCTFHSKRINDIVNWAVATCHKNSDVYYQGNTAENQFNPNGVIYRMFNTGHTLFSFYHDDPMYLLDISGFDYGYLPIPMFGTTQKDYVTVGLGGLMGVPKTVAGYKNIDATGAVIEAMSAISRKELYPNFIENYYDTRVLRDPQSKEIFQMMTDNTIYLLSSYISPAGTSVWDYFRVFAENKITNTSSYWKSNQDRIEKGYKRLFDAVKARS